MRTCPLQERRSGFGCLSNTHTRGQHAGRRSRKDCQILKIWLKKKKKSSSKKQLQPHSNLYKWMRQYAHTDVKCSSKMGERERWRCSCAWEGAAVRQGLLKESSRPRCSIARGLTVINESLNVGKHFISASSVFIRQGQPLAGRERAVTFITTTQKGERERPPIGLIKTPARHHDRSYSLLLWWHAAVIN